MRNIDFETLKKVVDFYGSDDLTINCGGEVKDGRGDYKFVKSYLTLRFGYYNQVNIEELQELFKNKSIKVVEETLYDSDCGCQFVYKLKDSFFNY